MAIFGTAFPLFSITFLVISALCLENFTFHNCTSITSTHHLKCWEARIHGLLAAEFQMNFPRGRGVGSKGAGELGSIFHPNRSLFMIFRGDFWGCWGCFWDCYLGFLWEIWGGDESEGCGFFEWFWGCCFLLLGRLSRFFLWIPCVWPFGKTWSVWKHKKNTGWVDSWLLSLCSVWKSGSCTNIPCGAARFSVQCPPVCRENMRKQLVDKFWYVPLKLEIFQISFH